MTAQRDTDILPAQPELEAIVTAALEEAKRLGASQAEAAVSADAGLSLTVRLGEVETLEYQRDRGLGVTVYFGQCKGSASTGDFSPEAIRDTVEAACNIARYTSEDPAAGLADAALMAAEVPDLDLLHPWNLPPESAIDLALACESAAREFDPRIHNSEGASVNTHRGLRVYGNSHGFLGGYTGTGHNISCAVLARDDNGMQRDFWYTASRNPADLEAPEAVGRKAAERTVARLGARRLGTRKVPVLYRPEVARGLIGHFLGAIRGSAQYRKASFLLDAEGQAVFPDFLQLVEQPRLPGALGSAPFDDDGVATAERAWIEDGRLTGYILDSYSARRLGRQTTGNAGGVRNLTVGGSARSFQDLVAEMGTGLVVTELMGQGVNGVTGDYSRGAAGFWVENGEIAYPVEEITVAGNLKDMYRGIQALGDDVDRRGNVRTGSILIDRMTVAGE